MSVDILLLFLLTMCINTANSEHGVIQCDNKMFCLRKPMGKWWLLRDAALQLNYNRQAMESNITTAMNNSFDNDYALMSQKAWLCKDETFAPFLLEDDVVNTTTSCIWTGSETSISCAPVPIKYKAAVFNYIPVKEWQDKVASFRVAIGCSLQEIQDVEEIQEAFICNDRCIQAGIGYLASLVMLLSFSLAIVYSCLM